MWYTVEYVPSDPLGENGQETENGVYEINDLYVVETQVGDAAVEHHLETDGYSQGALYKDNHGEDGQIFSATTDDHRYQVTYAYAPSDQIGGSGTGGVEGAFTVTNRRLGVIDMTVTKTWIHGEDSSEEAIGRIAEALSEIYETQNKRLVLAVRLQFADAALETQEHWEITHSGLGKADTVQVGGSAGEKVPIHDGQGTPAAADQILLSVDASGTVTTSDTAYFFNLPKYDAQGKVVEYDAREVWLEVGADGSLFDPLTESELAQYDALYDIWLEYTAAYESDYQADVEGHNTRDKQTIDITNVRTDTKTVTWYKEWQDQYAYENGLRPDIYLDIYRVVHVRDAESGEIQPQIERVRENLIWTSNEGNANSWTITLEGMQEYDLLGYEILYYAVERTVVAAGAYDYQAGRYSLNGVSLGSRDEPDEAAKADGSVLDLMGEGYQYSGYDPETLGIGAFDPGGVPQYPQYALIEEGTFTNALADTYTIEGVKYWTSLPGGWPEARLPSVTFSAYQYTVGDKAPKTPGSGGDPIAWVTIEAEEWASLQSGLGYRFLMEYQGENTLRVVNGQLVCEGEDGAAPLPRYDESGALHSYIVTETVNWGDDKPDAGAVFDTQSGSFTFTNAYVPDTGSITVKKHLYLPLEDGEPAAYPAVTFRLTRQVQTADGSGYEEDESFDPVERTLTSAQVVVLYQALEENNSWDGYVTDTLTFDDLPLYAPDGTEYRYTVTEVKDQLLGYDTWARTGDVTDPNTFISADKGTAIEDLTPDTSGAVAATFKNQQPEQPETYGTLTAVKVWEDFDNTFGFRPHAGGVPGAADPDAHRPGADGPGQPPPGGSSLYGGVGPRSGSTWTMTIQPADGAAAFDKYAPNGRAWTYTLSEQLTEDGKLRLDSDADAPANRVYMPLESDDGVWPTRITNSSSASFGTLTNSVETTARFAKQWQDAAGQPITEDRLGFELTVTFQLQVAVDGTENWEPAGDNAFVRQAMDDGFTDTQKLTGRIHAGSAVWSGSFPGLPTVVQAGETYTFLQYRVVETEVTYSGHTQDIPWDDTTGDYDEITDPGLVAESDFDRVNNTSTSTNTLTTMEVSVEKVWEDGNNQYNTRPDPDLPMTWTSWFVLRRSSDGGATWENVALTRLYGGDERGEVSGEGWSDTFSGLPVMDYGKSPAVKYTYQVWELQPSADGYTLATEAGQAQVNASLVEHEGVYNAGGSAYHTTYASTGNHWTVTNSLDFYNPGDQTITAVKRWAVPESDSTVRPSVVFQLQYRPAEGGEWQMVPFEGANQIVSAPDWTATWTDLPNTLNGREVVYQVIELPGEGWVQLQERSQRGEEQTSFTFTNTFTREFTVEKAWNPSTIGTHSVTVWLYRTTDPAEVGTAAGERVPVRETDSSQGYRTATLSSGSWSHTFQDLPRYAADQQPYLYYALELDGSGSPVEHGGAAALDQDRYVVTYQHTDGKTTVTNTPAMELSGTKTWRDDGNQGGGRPDSLTLILERKTSGETAWETVTGAVPTWSGQATDTWTYTYHDLPQYDESGNAYQYRVRETVPNGYTLENQQDGAEPGAVDAENGSYNFVNRRSDTVDLTVNKQWTGDSAADRPETIHLRLERKLVTEGEEAWQVVHAAQPAWTKTENTWTLTYTGLDQFDASGVRYQYRITETDDLAGYEEKGSANTDPTRLYELENIRLGGLTISKRVTGNAASTSKEFSFTVQLTGSSLAGTPAASVSGGYTAQYRDQNGAVTTGTIHFTNGAASTAITLRHGESVTISGLPAGLTYTVSETAESSAGYSVTSTAASGTIPAGSTAQAEFVNHRSSGPDPSRDTVDITGTKTWVDQGDAAGLRPADLELHLYRSVDGETWTRVSASVHWTKTGDRWTYTFRDLPSRGPRRSVLSL